jgi:hypothetical protein
LGQFELPLSFFLTNIIHAKKNNNKILLLLPSFLKYDKFVGKEHVMQPINHSTTFDFSQTKDGSRILKRRQSAPRPPTPMPIHPEDLHICVKCGYSWDMDEQAKKTKTKVIICWMCYKKEKERTHGE